MSLARLATEWRAVRVAEAMEAILDGGNVHLHTDKGDTPWREAVHYLTIIPTALNEGRRR